MTPIEIAKQAGTAYLDAEIAHRKSQDRYEMGLNSFRDGCITDEERDALKREMRDASAARERAHRAWRLRLAEVTDDGLGTEETNP